MSREGCQLLFLWRGVADGEFLGVTKLGRGVELQGEPGNE